jgi:hypothetical protein
MDMPAMSRALYFTLGMFADDDGVVGNPKGVMRQCGATDEDMDILKNLRYVLAFPSGVVVIKHWPINNYIRDDRHKRTTYVEEMATLTIDEKGAYTEKNKVCQSSDGQVSVKCQSTDGQVTENGIPSIGKDRLVKNKNNNSRKFTPPTIDEVKEYAQKRGNKVDPQKFFDYYTAGNWKDAKGNPVKNWKQKMITWESRQTQPTVNAKIHNFDERDYDFDELAKSIGVGGDT